MSRSHLLVMRFALLAVVMLAACGEAVGDTAAGDSGDRTDAAAPAADPGAAAGMCAEGTSDCVDTPQLDDGEPVALDETAIEQFRKDAKYYLGRPQDDLNELIRVARVDDEQMAVTDDYRIGRITVELDTVEKGQQPIVTSATVELPDGPETFELER